jgi:hypothetical protein
VAPNKKNRMGLWIGLGVGVVVLVIIIAAVAGGSKNKTTNATASTTTPPTVAATATTAATVSTTTAPSSSGLNKVAKDGDFAFTVTNAQCGLTTIGSEPQSAPPGTQWCVYTMTVANDKSTSQDFFAANQKAIDANGKQLSADTTALIYMDNGGASEDSTINPGVSITAMVPFQLSASDSVKQLVLHDSAFSGGVKVTVG